MCKNQHPASRPHMHVRQVALGGCGALGHVLLGRGWREGPGRSAFKHNLRRKWMWIRSPHGDSINQMSLRHNRTGRMVIPHVKPETRVLPF